MSQITELFGKRPLDMEVAYHLTSKLCPFVDQPCIKKHAGVCAVSNGSSSESVIVCPNRLYGDRYWILREVAKREFGVERFVLNEPNEIWTTHRERSPVVVARREVRVKTEEGQASFDWLLHGYDDTFSSTGVVAVEVQSMDITGSYSTEYDDIVRWHRNDSLLPPGSSKHGINWANVRKRLADQLLRKGAILSNTNSCRAFYFVLPDNVFHSFLRAMPNIKQTTERGNNVLTILTVDGADTPAQLKTVTSANFLLTDILHALYSADNAASLDVEFSHFDQELREMARCDTDLITL